MTKAQYQSIINDIESKFSRGYRLRLHLIDGNTSQGTAQLLGTNILVMTDGPTANPAYVDLGSVLKITVG
jgi:hypothetical protein